MKCQHCRAENFDVAITCVRCKKTIRASNPKIDSLFRSNPEPEPPTQISDIGLQALRFGPAPEGQTPSARAKRIRTPQSRPPVNDSQAQEKTNPSIESLRDPSPSLKNLPNFSEERDEVQPGIILFSVFVFSLGGVFLFLCLDCYSLYMLLNN
jgi:hypothetical protein